MNALPFTFMGQSLHARGTGALYWPERKALIVSDLHLGKTERMARRGGPLLPPYELRETLERLVSDINAAPTDTIICLGDSFDDLAAADAVQDEVYSRLAPSMAGRKWIWIEGNHDPGPVQIGGEHRFEYQLGPLTFRHIAGSPTDGEVSGHFHPKARVSLRGRNLTRPCFLVDERRLILPAYGTYTGGLFCHQPLLANLMGPKAQAILIGPNPVAFPMPRLPEPSPSTPETAGGSEH